ncbi:hypothetical protein [Clostridium sp. K04]|uniref:hypothetical protein n=1 Tax=Clostridium sp. K04 TaxID=2718929 RepID=UPI001C8CCFF8|nr:hypothetical protein [Clostridium sp. K04]MBX9184569.1 hypothetical protein [Clostridium sp. K04]
MLDYKDILQKLKNEIEEESMSIEVDTMSFIEDVNAKLTNDSKRYKDSNKIIFKQHISYENAEKIISLVNNIEGYNLSNIGDYKYELINICNIMDAMRENPVEILVYATKGLYGKDLYINAVRDVVKYLYEENSENVKIAYKSILSNWNWNDCIEFVLKSICELRIYDIYLEVYEIFEKNILNREMAARALLAINASEVYESMINFLCCQSNDTSLELELYKKILYMIAKENPNNTLYIYKSYLRQNLWGNVRNITIGAIRFNLSKVILDDIEKKLKNNQIDNAIRKKLIILLEKCTNGEDRAQEILFGATNRRKDKESLLGIITDRNSTDKERSIALITLAKMDSISNQDLDKVIANVINQSEVLNATICSAKVERGDNRYIIKLFEYILNNDEYSDVSIEASNQIKRLRGLNRQDLLDNLNKVAEKILDNEDTVNVKKVIKVIDLFSTGIPSDEIAELFLKKLMNTEYIVIKNKLLEFFRKEYSRFTYALKEKIKGVVVQCSYNEDTKKVAMECLNSINSLVDLAPTGGSN